MVFFSSLLVSLLFALTPFAIGALLVPVLCRAALISLPRFFLVPHLVISLLTHPFLNLAASIWLFLPEFLLLIAAPTVASAYAGSAVLFMLSNLFRNVIVTGNLVKDSFHELNPFDVKKNVRESVKEVFTSLEKLFDSTDFTEMFQGVKPPNGDSWGDFFKGVGDSMFIRYNFSEAMRNLTISESTQQYIDTVNAAVIGLLDNIEVSNVFNTTRIPPNLYTPLDEVSEAFRNLGEHLNFSEMLREVTVPSDVQESLGNLEDALETLGQNLNLTELFEALSSPTTEEALKKFRDPTSSFQSFWKSAETASGAETTHAFFKWVPIDLNIAAGIYIFLLVVGIPSLFLLRAALQDGCLWLITRRYESEIPSAQRSASGWMLVGASSGLALAAAETFPYCCFYSFLYNFNLLSAESVVVLILHTLTTAPLRAASQMRIAEASARRDVLKDNKPGFISGFVLAAVTNGIFNIWWMCFSVTLMISRIILWLPGLFIMADAVVVGLVVFWGRRICQRVLIDERQFIEDRERKRD